MRLDGADFGGEVEALRGSPCRQMELREVVALAESGRLSLEETEFSPLDRINEACERLKRGGVTGRIV
jgi:D-arabinose 1-dehydrogenase-like Zn-dependent alcohol dehydrogenase